MTDNHELSRKEVLIDAVGNLAVASDTLIQLVRCLRTYITVFEADKLHQKAIRETASALIKQLQTQPTLTQSDEYLIGYLEGRYP
jgi:hypothetical protein